MGEWSAFGLDELIAVARDMKPSLIIDPSLAFEFEIPKKGDAYWRSLERSSGLPDRKSLNPAAIVSASIFISARILATATQCVK